MTLYVDQFEPEDIKQLLAQSVPSQVSPLRESGWADYMWTGVDDKVYQVERKQWGEVLAGLDDVEEQLRREVVSADQTMLLVEGVSEPTQVGVDVFRRSASKPYWSLGHSYGGKTRPQPGMMSRLYSWFWQLGQVGVPVYFTSTSTATAVALVQFYHNCQKTEPTQVLSRHIVCRPRVKKWNPHVLTLMGISGVQLGEVRAKALVDRFGSALDVLLASETELCQVDGIGPVLAGRLWKAIR